ncbi:RRP12-like protein isoform X1 [Jatropha curcas]|uniref:RRP12-like protein isoform X1 n=1 Tax=Jatropha curcas TaxID=180498 RepID=UPI0005FBE380|nr:RRP12-like protein isoform X1 [Jatropha curcas]
MEPNIGTQTIEESETGFKDDSDICQQLLSRYSTSKAQHHRHLLATAAAIRSILSAESLPLSPPAYFAAAIDNLSDSETLDSTAVAALLSFVSIIVPLIPPKGINGDKASEAVTVLVAVVERDGLGAASVSCVIKCLGVLILGFCDLEDWGSVNLGFETVLKSSIDKRPKVRRTAQDCLEKVLKSLKSPSVIKESSKLVLSSFKRYMPMALTLSELKIEDGSKDETLSKSGNLEILHMLNLLKLTIPYLSVKLCSKILLELRKLLNSRFTALTRHIFKCIEAFFETSKEEVIGMHMEDFINSLSFYVSFGEKNPMDTVIYAATLLKIAFGKDCYGSTSGMKNVPKVCGSIAGLLNCETTTARQASDILKEIIKHCIDPKKLSTEGSQSFEDVSQESEEADMIKLTCDTFESTLSSYNGIPNEHLLEVISTLFLKLRSASFIFMKNFVLKLADLMNCVSQDKPDTYHLRDCIGSAVVAMGPERILTLIPISVHADNFTCSNVWLVPILKRHIAGSSLRYYMEHIVPLAKSFMRASHKVKKSVIGQDLLACAHGLWELLPSFCNYPVDTQKKFGSLAELLITLLKEDSSMHQNVAVALQLLVSQNRSALISEDNAGKSGSNAATDTLLEFRSVTSYSKKTATRNIGALASWSTELLQALVDLFVDSPAEKRLYIKDAVGCLASITDSSITKRILMSLLERLQLVNGRGEFEHLMSHGDELIGTEEGNISAKEKDVNRCVIMELASSLIEGAKEDLINLIYNYVVHIVKETDVLCHCEAYNALSRILKEHAWLCSSRYGEVIDLLLSQKPPTDVASLRNRFACFHILMVHMLEISLEEENAKAFLMLNEIILTLKDAKDEARKVAYDTLLVISSAFRNSSSAGSEESYHKLISMIMGYLSGPSPHIKSGAVSALSALVYEDADVCLKMPDLVPSLLSLLQNKAVEVIKAALGFVKVIVSSLQANDLQNLLSDITSGILLWSTVSRFHFRSKVTVILEIMIRKCGSAAVEFVTPEKYKNFVKTVLQNRHHKSTSKEAVSNDVETVVAGSSGKRVDKKHKELSSAFEENGSAPHRKRKRKNKENETPTSRKLHKSSGNDRGPKGAKRARPSKYEESTTGQPADIRKKRNFIDEQTNSGKKRKERSNLNKEGNTAKFRRHDKFGGKKRKS